MSNAFDRDNVFMTTFSGIIDTIILGILWLICCIPVFTVGAASSALYYAYHKSIRQEKSYAWKEFFAGFKSNFKQATAIWLILLVFTLMSAVTCYLLRVLRDSIPVAGVLLAMGTVIIGFMVIWCLYIFPYQARFENTMVNTMKNSALIAFSNLLWSLLLLGIFAAAVIITLYKPVLLAVIIAVYIWIANIILERIFRGLMTEEELKSEIESDG